MEIILHAHHAEVSASLRSDAETAVRRIATRLRRVVDAIVRFEADGRTRRVEILLRTPRRRDLIAIALDRQFEPALALAVNRLETRVARVRRTRRVLARHHGAAKG